MIYAIIDNQTIKTLVEINDNKILESQHIYILEKFFQEYKIVHTKLNKNFFKENTKYINGEFIFDQPFPSWIWKNNQWVPPVKRPKDYKNVIHIWNEKNKNWEKFFLRK